METIRMKAKDIKWDKATHLYKGEEVRYSTIIPEEILTIRHSNGDETELTQEDITKLVEIIKIPTIGIRVRIFFQYITAIFNFLCSRAYFTEYKFDGTKFNYTVCFVARWYSPFFLIYAALLLTISIFRGGLIEGIQQLKRDLSTTAQMENAISMSGSFREHVSMLHKKTMLFRLIWN